MRIVANDVCPNQNCLTPTHGRPSRDADIQEDQQRQEATQPVSGKCVQHEFCLLRGQVVMSADCHTNESKHSGITIVQFGQRRCCEHEICG